MEMRGNASAFSEQVDSKYLLISLEAATQNSLLLRRPGDDRAGVVEDVPGETLHEHFRLAFCASSVTPVESAVATDDLRVRDASRRHAVLRHCK